MILIDTGICCDIIFVSELTNIVMSKIKWSNTKNRMSNSQIFTRTFPSSLSQLDELSIFHSGICSIELIPAAGLSTILIFERNLSLVPSIYTYANF